MKGGEKGETKDEEVVSSGLLGGVTAYHLRILIDNPWSGGAGYTLEQVSRMTLDQIWSRLCEIDILKKDIGKRTQKMAGLEAAGQLCDKDGNMRGRSAQGEEIKLRASGESKAAMLKKGTYEGWVINSNTGEKEWITPRNKQGQSESKRRSDKRVRPTKTK